jgi:hypothetical protein
MATLDISGALQAMVAATTPQAMMERNMATAMFAGRVTEVMDSAIDKYLETAKQAKELLDMGIITPETHAAILQAREEQLSNAKRFSAGYFA